MNDTDSMDRMRKLVIVSSKYGGWFERNSHNDRWHLFDASGKLWAKIEGTDAESINLLIADGTLIETSTGRFVAAKQEKQLFCIARAATHTEGQVLLGHPRPITKWENVSSWDEGHWFSLEEARRAAALSSNNITGQYVACRLDDRRYMDRPATPLPPIDTGEGE